MKLLKYLFIGVVILLLIGFLFTLFIPKQYEYSTQKEIDAPYEYLSYLSSDLDAMKELFGNTGISKSKMRFRTSDQTQGQGASLSWGPLDQGNQIIISDFQPRVQTVYTVQQGNRGNADLKWTFHPSPTESKTVLSAKLNIEAKVPYNALMYFQGNGTGEILNVLLDQIKKKVEASSQFTVENQGFRVGFEQFSAQKLNGIEENVAPDATADFLRTSFDKILNSTQSTHLSNNFGLFHQWNEEEKTTKCAAMTTEALSTRFKSLDLNQNKTLTAQFIGDYSNISKAHSAVHSIIDKLKLTPIAPVVEGYVSDPRKLGTSSKDTVMVYYLYTDK